MSVIIRRTGYSYTWTCRVIPKNATKPCNHVAVANTEQEAKDAYKAHKKTAAGH